MTKKIYYTILDGAITFCLPLNKAPERAELNEWHVIDWEDENFEERLRKKTKVDTIHFRIMPNNWVVFWTKEKEGSRASTIAELAEAVIETRDSGNNQSFWDYYA